RDRVLQALLPSQREERTPGGVAYHAAQPPRSGSALHFADAQTFLFGPEAEVRAVLDRPRGQAGPWSAALRLARRKQVVVAGFYPPDVLEGWLGAKLVNQKLTLKPLLSARSGVLTVDVDENQETRLELVVDFPEQTPAGPNQAAIEAAL